MAMLSRIVKLWISVDNCALQCRPGGPSGRGSHPENRGEVSPGSLRRMRGQVLSILRNSGAAVLVLSAAVVTAGPLSAETIDGALAKAYSYNSTLNSARAGVRVT